MHAMDAYNARAYKSHIGPHIARIVISSNWSMIVSTSSLHLKSPQGTNNFIGHLKQFINARRSSRLLCIRIQVIFKLATEETEINCYLLTIPSMRKRDRDE